MSGPGSREGDPEKEAARLNVRARFCAMLRGQGRVPWELTKGKEWPPEFGPGGVDYDPHRNRISNETTADYSSDIDWG